MQSITNESLSQLSRGNPVLNSGGFSATIPQTKKPTTFQASRATKSSHPIRQDNKYGNIYQPSMDQYLDIILQNPFEDHDIPAVSLFTNPHPPICDEFFSTGLQKREDEESEGVNGKILENPYWPSKKQKKPQNESQNKKQLHAKALKQKLEGHRNNNMSYLINSIIGPKDPQFLQYFKNQLQNFIAIKEYKAKSSAVQRKNAQINVKKSHQYFFFCLSTLYKRGYQVDVLLQMYEGVKIYKKDKRTQQLSEEEYNAIKIQFQFTQLIIHQFYRQSKAAAIRQAYDRNNVQKNNHRRKQGEENTINAVKMVLGEEFN